MPSQPAKRSPGEDSDWRLRLLGVILIPLVIFPVLALVSYQSSDVPFNNSSGGGPSMNMIGPVGAGLTWVGYLLFGFASWLLPALMLAFGLFMTLLLGGGMIAGRRRKRRLSGAEESRDPGSETVRRPEANRPAPMAEAPPCPRAQIWREPRGTPGKRGGPAS